MSLMKIFQGSKLKISWTHQSKEIIWRLLPTSSNLLIGEARNPEMKQVSFFCIDARTGKPFWQNLTFDEQWWVGIEGVHRDVLFFHEFATPELPEHKKIRAVKTVSGEQLWVNEEVQFFKASGNVVYVSKMGFEQQQFFELDLLGGSIRREISFEDVSGLEAESDFSGTNIQFPSHLNKDESIANSLKGIVVKEIKSSVYAEHIEHGAQVIVGYYLPAEKSNQEHPMLNQYLMVGDSRGKQVFQDVINVGVSYPTPDGFLCMNDTLYYIRNRKELVAVDLSSE